MGPAPVIGVSVGLRRGGESGAPKAGECGRPGLASGAPRPKPGGPNPGDERGVSAVSRTAPATSRSTCGAAAGGALNGGVMGLPDTPETDSAPPATTGARGDVAGEPLPERPRDTESAGSSGAPMSSPQFTLSPTEITAPQMEQRARSVVLVILAGSTRKSDRHSGQATFICQRRR